MPRRRSALPLVLLLLLLGGGAATWWATTSSSSDSDDDPSAPRATSKTAPSKRSRGATTAPTTTSATSDAPAKPKPEDEDWRARLRRLLDGDTSIDPATLVAAAGKGRPPGDGLVQVLKGATAALAAATDPAARRRAQDLVDWVVGRVLEPYRKDRARFAPLYRQTRFGDGDLSRQGGSLVRELRFEDAAAAMDAVRGELWTWCYDALAVRAAATFRLDQKWWDWLRRTCEQRKWDVPPAARTTAADTTPPAALFGVYVRPHLAELDFYMAMGIGRVFLDLGELDASTECFARTRQALSAPEYAAAQTYYSPWLDELDVEVAAFRDLRGLTALRLPAAAADSPAVGRWFAARRLTDVAHAIGTDGDVEIGPWDDSMTASFLSGGLPWAPEQWQVERAVRDAAKTETIGGISGWTVKSKTWDVFSDVSAEFAAQASLVLESGWTQAQIGLGVEANPRRRLGARVYKHREAYRAVTHDSSGGEWMPKLNAVLSFVSDPLHDDFEEFHWPTLLHEATHAAVQWSVGGAPPWMNEGLACFVGRWNPTWSQSANWGSTKDWVRRKRSLERSRDQKLLPTLDELLAISVKLDVDDMGPITGARYDAAESFFVYLAGDPARWKRVGEWLALCAKRQDPTPTITAAERVEWAKGWAELIDFVTGRLESR